MDGRDGDDPVARDAARPLLTDGGTDPLAEPDGAPTGNSDPSEPQTDGSGEGAAAPEQAGGGIPVTRRQAFFGGGALALVGIGVGASHVLRPARAVEPDVPTDALEAEDWVLVDEVSETVLEDSAGPVSIQAVASTVRYEDQGLIADIKDREVTIEFRGQTATERLGDHAGGQFDQSMGVFAATKIDLTPHVDELPAGIGRAQVMGPVEEQASAQFEQQLQEAGLENVRQVEPSVSFEPDSGALATFFEYRGSFTFESSSFEVRGVPLSIPGGAIEIAGYLAIWHNGRNVIVAAGAHPDENYTDTVTETVAGEDLTVGIDLGLRPSELREEVLGYMAAVE